jgi:hypothetical protein
MTDLALAYNYGQHLLALFLATKVSQIHSYQDFYLEKTMDQTIQKKN